MYVKFCPLFSAPGWKLSHFVRNEGTFHFAAPSRCSVFIIAAAFVTNDDAELIISGSRNEYKQNKVPNFPQFPARVFIFIQHTKLQNYDDLKQLFFTKERTFIHQVKCHNSSLVYPASAQLQQQPWPRPRPSPGQPLVLQSAVTAGSR